MEAVTGRSGDFVPPDARRVRRQVWLGAIAATRGGPRTVALGQACERFLDHYLLR